MEPQRSLQAALAFSIKTGQGRHKLDPSNGTVPLLVTRRIPPGRKVGAPNLESITTVALMPCHVGACRGNYWLRGRGWPGRRPHRGAVGASRPPGVCCSSAESFTV